MKITQTLAAFTLLAIASVATVQAQNLVTNGSMSHPSYPLPPDPPNSHNGIMPTGWSSAFGSTDLFHIGTNFQNGGSAFSTFVSSSDGGTFVSGLTFPGSLGEGIQQTINGLTIGQQYLLTFEQTVSRRFASEDAWWEVSFGSETFISDIMTTPAPGVALPWVNQSMLFTPTASSQALIFLPRGTTGQNTWTVLDGVSLVAVPEPTSALFVGLSGMILLFRRRR
ncbi:PEP-CTERM sorting domain-containing protein [Phragmitibacter flavus]|uniref:PEP-CTERM sorting domain-containing protein n=1 Tax=Phragmitibacter flavus TaxID=2576071 RepID=A0A5R8KDI8_9BACT|nr:PEP-CTERM sorting domain-containing protein [Phragmitibacter flavus]TLD70372.1 PEP-CTERM sorting domain-containing protein [Phragmitibacter flavus]